MSDWWGVVVLVLLLVVGWLIDLRKRYYERRLRQARLEEQELWESHFEAHRRMMMELHAEVMLEQELEAHLDEMEDR